MKSPLGEVLKQLEKYIQKEELGTLVQAIAASQGCACLRERLAHCAQAVVRAGMSFQLCVCTKRERGHQAELLPGSKVQARDSRQSE